MTIRNMLKYASKDRLQEWAARQMCGITDKHTLALHIAGWKIVANDDDPDASTPKWPFDSKAFDCDCPEWCDDISARRDATQAAILEFPDGPK